MLNRLANVFRYSLSRSVPGEQIRFVFSTMLYSMLQMGDILAELQTKKVRNRRRTRIALLFFCLTCGEKTRFAVIYPE